MKIKNLYFSPVKSLSFNNVDTLEIIKNIGIKNDRIFAFSNNLNIKDIELIKNNPLKREIYKFLSLKKYPELNEYNFLLENNFLILEFENKIILKTDINNQHQVKILCSKLEDMLPSINNINLLKDSMNPFFDTMPNKSISLINLNSIKDFEKLSNYQVEHERFRGNIYVEDLDKWEERKLVGKVLSINHIKFKVIKEIPRCSATNIKPKTSDINLNIPFNLKKIYNHINLGIYLDPLNDGKINKRDLIKINE
ncbi:MOSC domain-containing protein [Pelagibacteraceae bacterium]|nr:MOSC domain-containing protein [Pelagibacteraceae bacterium]